MFHCENTLLQRSLLMLTCTLWALLCPVFCVAQGNTHTELNLYAAHYAQRGYSRLGLAGYGEFLGYSFGRTNSCGNTAFEVLEGPESIYDCPENAEKLFTAAVKKLDDALRQCRQCNKQLDRPGGPHGH